MVEAFFVVNARDVSKGEADSDTPAGIFAYK